MRTLLACFAAILLACGDGGGSDAGTEPRDTAEPRDAPPLDAPEPLDAPAADVATDGPRDAGPTDPCAGGACGPCDDGLALASTDALEAARAMGICAPVSARWTLPSGGDPPAADYHIGHGIMTAFGVVTPREGTQLLAISSGAARSESQPDFTPPTSGRLRGHTSAAPAGFPLETPRCGGLGPSGTLHDATTLEVVLDVPAGANGLRFLVKDHVSDWPDFVCSTFVDAFSATMSPAPDGSIMGELAFDPMNGPVGANSTFIDVCSCGGGACSIGGLAYPCSAGEGELNGTGFDGLTRGAATRWLEVRAPATPGERITLRFSVWDAGDGTLDTTALLDGFRWITDAPAGPETRVLP